MKPSGPIFMRQFSASRHAFEVGLGGEPVQPAQYGVAAVLNATWLETHGDMETSISERWMLVAPDIWRVISKKS